MYIGLEIQVNYQNGESVTANIVGLHDKGILVSVPRGSLSELEEGKNCEVFYTDRNAELKTFQTELKRKIRSTNLALLSYPEQIEKSERRNFFRVSPWKEIDVHYSFTDMEIDPHWLRFGARNANAMPILPSSYRKARLIDVSGGGAAIATEMPIKQGKRMGLFIMLKDQLLKVNGTVVGCKGDSKPYKIAIKFYNLKESQTDQIIRFVFEQASGFIREEQAQKRQNEVGSIKERELAEGPNKREALRLCDLALPVEFKIVYSFKEAIETAYKEGLLRNISITGASFLSKVKIHLETDILLKLPIGNDFVKVLGVCLRCRPLEQLDDYEIGLKFKALDSETENKLASFIYGQDLKSSIVEEPEQIATQPK